VARRGRHGEAKRGMASSGKERQAWSVVVGFGGAQYGLTRQAWLGWARYGLARQAGFGVAWRGAAGLGLAWYSKAGMARLGMEW